MGFSLYCFFSVSMMTKLVMLLLHLMVANSLYSFQQHQQPSCHEEESSALLQFKQSFIINASASLYDGAYPKLSSWKLPAEGEINNTCCSWDGVQCDEKSGHVINLDLSSSWLYGSINSNSSLFRLVHLQSLNLADNNFNYSQIPTAIRNFPRLTYLNLSNSVFSGQIPSQVSHLYKLSFLDLSLNVERLSGDQGLLKLDASNMRSLVQNLTSLEKLHLSFVNISSTVPDSIANLSFLTSLILRECGFFGEFPVRIFKLQNLEILSVRSNKHLTGFLPEFNRTSPLTVLKTAETSFYGDLPSSMENLHSLKELDVGVCNFSQGPVPSVLGKLRQLTYLDISDNKFQGPIPNSFANLTQLVVLRMLATGLIGPIPSWLGNFSSLIYLDLAYNQLHGSVPASFSKLLNLEILYLNDNSLSGIVEFNMFQNLQKLYQLQLIANNLEVLFEPTTTNVIHVQQFTILSLGSCNVREFPYILRYQKYLKRLDLSRCEIHGLVPKWLWNISTQTLEFLDLSGNFLSGFEQPPVELLWVNLQLLRLASNRLHGPLPIPPPSLVAYEIQNNKLTGEISPLICNLSRLKVLDLSNNALSGMLPQCLGNFSDDLILLLLGNNFFQGILPQTYTNKSNLSVIDVSHNQLEGQLPRSLVNCLVLEHLLLSNNKFSDVFPIWLGTLSKLKILAMRHNGLYGVIGKPEQSIHGFPQLRILDMSYNNFTGEFLIDYVFSEIAMIMRSNITVNQSTYMTTYISYNAGGIDIYYNFGYSITIAIKGVDRYYAKIQEAFAAIDLSNNKFEGKIDHFVGNLKGLRSFNISNNLFTGSIPSSLGSLSLLESLDLSLNKLSGKIPQQLTQLTFLSEFNVSYNNLSGVVPQGTQLTTINSTSYEGNPGLCGAPLPKKCGDPEAPQPPPTVEDRNEDNDSTSSGLVLEWKFVLAGFGSGLVVGVVLSDVVIARKREGFIKIVGIIREMVGRD